MVVHFLLEHREGEEEARQGPVEEEEPYEEAACANCIHLRGRSLPQAQEARRCLPAAVLAVHRDYSGQIRVGCTRHMQAQREAPGRWCDLDTGCKTDSLNCSEQGRWEEEAKLFWQRQEWTQLLWPPSIRLPQASALCRR